MDATLWHVVTLLCCCGILELGSGLIFNLPSANRDTMNSLSVVVAVLESSTAHQMVVNVAGVPMHTALPNKHLTHTTVTTIRPINLTDIQCHQRPGQLHISLVFDQELMELDRVCHQDWLEDVMGDCQ
jgi:hypothetical protein